MPPPSTHSCSAVSLAAPTAADAQELLGFELANREFFESMINARPAGYYSLEGVRAAIAQAEQDAREDQGYQFLLRDGEHRLAGRINLSHVRRANFHAASLGYRIGADFQGRGLAKAAMRLVLVEAFTRLGLERLDATARPENIGSLRVLLSGGFRQFGHSRRSFELGGEWFDLLHFERHAADWRIAQGQLS
ncbi:ribosomal-protein-alanine N-acetyltransferase [Paucibacter oligotrophus]|uniref:Ribosomal-protein-alanine N-acetyltransferase n=1 Tax=Roseateles oligotrophus TaxID=1769250 RepID=A0A840LID0_9BURK|nr:GNAT family protein [Roseateles oligotrophus]MBB4845749.1 ribosomal-protein-alanine N-acetyltransferase [Roseateles oligotrophus]